MERIALACHKNALLRACYEQLREEGVPELYYLSCREIGLPDDALGGRAFIRPITG